jgi:hypothetical protein
MHKTKTTVLRFPSLLKTTEVFETYWYLAAERQAIFFRRLENDTLDYWTDDHILKKFKFTNAYRASDRVSQYLIKNVIYKGDQSPQEVFFRILLFKLFNRIETWELLERELEVICYEGYTFENYDRLLTKVRERKEKIYSAAYIMPSGVSSLGFNLKHRNHLKLLEMMMTDELPLRLMETKSMKQAFELLRSYPTIGDFLAYQFVTDLNYSELLNFPENEFVVPGPGALSGLRKCFSSYEYCTETDLINLVMERQEEEFAKRGINFKSLWGRPLQLIDCQNLFCEVDKYARVKHPEVKGISDRKRIKQHYKPNPKCINYWYPPKWRINHSIEQNNKITTDTNI